MQVHRKTELEKALAEATLGMKGDFFGFNPIRTQHVFRTSLTYQKLSEPPSVQFREAKLQREKAEDAQSPEVGDRSDEYSEYVTMCFKRSSDFKHLQICC